MQLTQQNIAQEQIKHDQRASFTCAACEHKTLQYRLHIAELVMRRAGLYFATTTPEEVYHFAMNNIDDRALCYKCLLKRSAE
jgi:hypothetical protein